MPQPSATTAAEITESIAAAVQEGDMVLAEKLLDQLGEAADPRLHAAIAGVFMHRCLWDQAVTAFDRIREPDLNCQLQRRLAANLTALQAKRPDVYKIAVETQPQTHCQVAPLASGGLTITQAIQDRKPVSLSRESNPINCAQRTLKSISKALDSRHAILLIGVGDGYLLAAVAEMFARIGGEFLSTVYIVEPDTEVLVNCMMIHDYTGPSAPIECENFRWFVGPDWQQQFRRIMENDLFMPPPSQSICLSLHGEDLSSRVQQIVGQRKIPQRRLKEEVEKYYRTQTRQQLLDLLGPTPPRPPRAMVITCRFTTVLQYSSRDMVHAFERLGWQAQLLMEPSAYHRLTYDATRQAMLEFKPDLVICIDHLRYETRNLYPENLPHVCWIQDDLTNLTTTRAGESIGRRDFVLTANRPTYCGLYGYPKQQCIDMGKLTRSPQRPARWSSDGDDLVYVSNASQTGEEIAEKLIKRTAGDTAARQLLRACCDRMLAVYRRGDTIETNYQVAQIVETVGREQGFVMPTEDQRFRLVSQLIHPFQDALYRQQGLAWAANVAEKLGLTLAVYGNGWDKHPVFAPQARGSVTYGPDLERLTRSARINLRLEPYTSLSHQRLADGLVAGGFFLNRTNHAECELQALASFMHAHVDHRAGSLCEARAAVDPEHRAEFEALVDRCMKLYHVENFDPIEGVRISQAEGALAQCGPSLPALEDISFNSLSRLEALVRRFLDNARLRQDIARRQRADVEARLTYEAGMRRAMGRIGQLIAAETQGATPPQKTDRIT